MIKSDIKAFVSGIHNRIDSELIPKDAASSSIGWLTKDGRIELMYGRSVVGAEGASGKNYGEHTAYRADGTAVRFRKVGTAIQYLNGSTWTNSITGLTACDVTFTNYVSLAGNFVYVGSPEDGLYLIAVANPTSYAALNDTARNFKGYCTIDKGRMFMWHTSKDKTGLYGSWIDGQDSDVYTTVSAEAVAAVESGTLAFKAGGSKRTCFGVVITDTSSGEVFTDNLNGVLTGSLGNSGTINYMTGAFTITGQAGAGTADYQWWDTNVKGPTDFTKSATRLAGEGFVVRQDAGGDEIKVVIPHDGSYFSIKERSVYQFTLDAADLNPTNELIRSDIGVQSLRGAVATGLGILFLDTGNTADPQMQFLKRNPVGDNFDVTPIFPQFDFSSYLYDDAALEAWDRFVVVACKSDSDENNTLILCDMTDKTVSIAPYPARCFTKLSGRLYGGDPLSQTTYEYFSGFDDMTTTVQNEYITARDTYGDSVLKKAKRLRFRGLIDPNQSIKVYISIDDGVPQWIGTILGSGDYVDYNSSFAVGTTYIGQDTMGGGDTTPVYSFLMEIKMRVTKYRKRELKFVAQGYGYCAIQEVTDFDIVKYRDKLPKSYRIKQNVSLSGEITDEDTPTY